MGDYRAPEAQGFFAKMGDRTHLSTVVYRIMSFFVSSMLSIRISFGQHLWHHLLSSGTAVLIGMLGWLNQPLVLEESIWPLAADASDPGFQKMNGGLTISSSVVGAFIRALILLCGAFVKTLRFVPCQARPQERGWPSKYFKSKVILRAGRLTLFSFLFFLISKTFL